MDSYKKRAFRYSTIVAMGGFVFGLDAALISGTLNFLTQEFSLTDLELGTVVSSPALGVLLALPFAGYACDALGRKRTLQIIGALYLISALGSTFAPSYFALVIARFIGGLAFSSISIASMYIGEIAPAQLRGKLVSMIQINIVIGLSAAYFLNYVILQFVGSDAAWVQTIGLAENVWRWMLGTEIVFVFIWLLFLLGIPESPSWLVFKNRIEDAKNTLRKLLPENEIEGQMDDMGKSLKNAGTDRSFRTQFKEIFGKPMRIALIIGITFAIAQQATGINAILFYAPVVFEQLGIGADAAFAQAIWIGLVSLVFTVLAITLVDRLGRRPMILWGMVWIVISLGIASYGFNSARYTLTEQSISEMNEIPDAQLLSSLVGVEYASDIEFKQAIQQTLGEENARKFSSLILEKGVKLKAMLILISILSFIAAFHFSIGPLMWVVFSEIFPISVRGIAIPFFTLITSTTSYLIQQFFPWQLATMGISATLLFYAVTVVMGLLILYRFLPETKNMTIEEIQFALQKK